MAARHRLARSGRVLGLILLLGALHCEDAPWRSALYPEDWTPAFTEAGGRFLHDFSYAGYHSGEDPIPVAPAGAIHDVVVDHGADPTGVVDATAAIQAGIDAAGAAGGGVVFLPAGLSRCDGQLVVTSPGVVLRGEGASTRVFFTSFAGMTDRAHVELRGDVVQGPHLPLVEDGVSRSTVVRVADATSLSIGDDVSVGWTISDEFVADHGMTGTWVAFVGQWKPFFRRTVVDLDLSTSRHEVTLDVPLRYPALIRDGASLRTESGYLTECGIESMALSNAVGWEDAWTELRVHVIELDGVADGWVRDVESFDSGHGEGDHLLQSGGILVLRSKRITVADSRMEKAQNRGNGGAGYLFEVSRSGEVLVRDSVGLDGRHNFIQNWDFGTSGTVFLRVESARGQCRDSPGLSVPIPCFSEFHHSLAMANLIDSSVLLDGWFGGNRLDMSSGAGHTVTETAYWNVRGPGLLASWQYGHGHVIGTEQLTVTTAVGTGVTAGTEPEDWVEGKGKGDGLEPGSLYEDQLARRPGLP